MNSEFDSDILRRKSSMIVFSIERALGSYVSEREKGQDFEKLEPTLELIESRSGEATKNIGRARRLRSSVAASYLDEVLNLALLLSEGTSEFQAMEELVELCRKFELYKIRNAVSHPNRVFPDSYWYRAAALASDPVVSKLGFESVIVSLQAAEEGKITIPPEEWMNSHRSFVRNNLPKQFEHELTGLVGRQKERKELLKLLSKSKHPLIAVVAPGGLGKTAVILEVLQEMTLDPEIQEVLDSIAYVTLKQEKLTADGIERLNASQTIDQLKCDLTAALLEIHSDSEFSDFSAACDTLENSKILICIDNLETIAGDRPEDFIAMYEEMPAAWRVVITSRVTVDSAKTFSLGMLGDEGARALTYRYLASKGDEAPSNDIVERIQIASAGNPLAIRLMVDRFVRGHQVMEATSMTSRDIVSFSYKNLMETLSPQAIFVVEALFVRESFSRSELCDLLEIDGEVMSDSLRQLVRTSLVIRNASVTDDYYALSPSIRDLLRDNPTDLSVRKRVKEALTVQARMVRQHQSIQNQHGFSPYSEDFIPDYLTSSLSSVLVVAIKLLRSDSNTHGQIISTIERLSRAVDVSNPNTLALVTLARLYVEAGDDLAAEDFFERAATSDSISPMPRLALVNFLLQRERVEEGLPLCEQLIRDNWGNPSNSDGFTARRIWTLYFRALKETGERDLILEKAKALLENAELSVVGRIACVQALILKAQPLHSDSPNHAAKLLDEAIGFLEGVLVPNRSKQWYSSFRFFCKEAKHLLDRHFSYEFPVGFRKRLLKLMVDNMIEGFEDENFERRRGIIRGIFDSLIKAFGQEAHDALSLPRFRWFLPAEQSQLKQDLMSNGYDLLTVYKIPNSRDGAVNFVFAENANREPYFIPRSACENFDWELWAKLDVGSQLGAKGFERGRGSRDYPVAKAVILL